MKQTNILYGIIGLLLGSLITVAIVKGVSSSTSPSDHMEQMMGSNYMTADHGASMTMVDMVKALDGLADDAFDKAFIEMMIDHHQGAVDMAEAAKTQAKHEELKNMATQIIDTQTQEIIQMRQWLKDWGYTSN